MSERIYADRKYVEEYVRHPDWDQNDSAAATYVKNRTHWKESTEQVLVSINGLVFSEDNSNIVEWPVDFELVVGAYYNLSVDDESHIYTAVEHSSGLVYIGDFNGDIVALVNDGILRIQMSESGTHSIKIAHVETNAHFVEWFAKAAQSDWEEGDETAIGYVNNKPFGRTVTANTTHTLFDADSSSEILTYEPYGDFYMSPRNIRYVTTWSRDTFGFVPNCTYNITLRGDLQDSKVRTGTCKRVNYYGIDVVIVGNASLISSSFEDTDEDFIILYDEPSNEVVVMIKASAFSETTSDNELIINITGPSYKYSTISNHYLSSEIPRKSELDNVVRSVNDISPTGGFSDGAILVPPCKYKSDEDLVISGKVECTEGTVSSIYESQVMEITPIELVVGETYKYSILYHGEDSMGNAIPKWHYANYELIENADDSSMLILGNLGLINGTTVTGTDTDCFVLYHNDYVIHSVKVYTTREIYTDEDSNFSITGIHMEYIPIEEKLVPTTIPRIINASVGQTIVVKSVDENGKPTEWEAVDPWVMPSSTEGSNKKFKLTIDDNGAITISEIIEEDN